MSAGARRHHLDSRAWLAWGAAVSVPLLAGRHPLVLAELLIIVLVVRSVCLPAAQAAAWGWMVRVGAIAVPIGVIFNMFTVHAGDHALFRVPESVLMIGGVVTLNAVVYGTISGLTIVALVVTGTTVAAAIDWGALMRLLPHRAAGIAVAGSVAWGFLPQLATSWREIREAQAARGHIWKGPGDLPQLVVPLLAGGLDRSMAMAEALESRGFGATAPAPRPSVRSAIPVALGVTVAVLGLYLFAVGRSVLAAVAILFAVATGIAAMRISSSGSHRPTRYRQPRWAHVDSVVVAGAGIAVAATGVMLQVDPAALRYEPYPSLEWPATSVVLIVALAMLMLPAVVAPAPIDEESGR